MTAQIRIEKQNPYLRGKEVLMVANNMEKLTKAQLIKEYRDLKKEFRQVKNQLLDLQKVTNDPNFQQITENSHKLQSENGQLKDQVSSLKNDLYQTKQLLSQQTEPKPSDEQLKKTVDTDIPDMTDLLGEAPESEEMPDLNDLTEEIAEPTDSVIIPEKEPEIRTEPNESKIAVHSIANETQPSDIDQLRSKLRAVIENTHLEETTPGSYRLKPNEIKHINESVELNSDNHEKPKSKEDDPIWFLSMFYKK